MKRTLRVVAAGAAAALALASVSACTAPSGGGEPAANLGCFVTIFQTTSVKIFMSNGSTYHSVYQNPTCSGEPEYGPTWILPGEPSPTGDAICRSLHGPEAYSTVSNVGHLMVPPQTFTVCNYPLV
jgi:hypothetical protein